MRRPIRYKFKQESSLASPRNAHFILGNAGLMEFKCSVGRGQFFKARQCLEVDSRKRGTGLEMKIFPFVEKKEKRS